MDELNLYKMATYVKQYIKSEQSKRYLTGIMSESSVEEKQSVPNDHVVMQNSAEMQLKPQSGPASPPVEG